MKRAPIRRSVLACILLAGSAAATTPGDEVSTAFQPNADGFQFSNTFDNDVVQEVDLRTSGLCGGMVYAALDYFHSSSRRIPTQDYRPANRTVLQSYLYGRQVDALMPNLTKWAEISLNPGGVRNDEFFRWGLTSELENLRSHLDAGEPVPLGVIGVKSVKHYILAIGYEVGATPQDLAITVYDPNHPGREITMRANADGHCYDYEGYATRWRTYFVDKSYAAKTPPAVRPTLASTEDSIRELLIRFDTGDDDLRGGNDNVDLGVVLANGERLTRNNINLGARWLSNYSETASVMLPRAVARRDIRRIEFSTTFGGGIGGDNWDVRSIRVEACTAGSQRLTIARRNEFFRFTGDRKTLHLDPAPSPTADLASGAPVGVGDVDGDGTDDILFRQSDGRVVYWKMADGAHVATESCGKPGLEWSLDGVGDVDGDGTDDLVWRHAEGRAHVWPMRDGRPLPGADIGKPGLDWRLAGAGDVDGDGTDDVVWRHESGLAHFWAMKDGASTGGRDFGKPGLDWELVGVGDVDGDGTDDVVWRHDNGRLYYWPMEGGAAGTGRPIYNPVPDTWEVIGAGDVNGDGTDDIVWFHVSGKVHYWSMQGGERTVGVDIGSISGSPQEVGTVEADAPAAASPPLVSRLRITLQTGDDDLRGNEDNVDATVHFSDGTSQTFRTLNERKRWEDGSRHRRTLQLSQARAKSSIVGITLSTTFGGGLGGDNWNLDRLVVEPYVGSAYYDRTGAPLKRFTGDDGRFTVRW